MLRRWRVAVAVVAMAVGCAGNGPGLRYTDAETGEERQVNAACDTVSEGGTAAIEEWRDFAKQNQAELVAKGGEELLDKAKFAQIALDEALEVLEPLCLGQGADAGSADRMRVRIEAVQAARDRLLGVLLLAQGLLTDGGN